MNDTEIIPLNQNNFREALGLVNSIFGEYSADDDPNFWFEASLDPIGNGKIIKERSVRYARYFAMIDKKTGKVIGTTGLYSLLKEPADIAWLGWFCLNEKYRGKGIGKRILQWTIDKAKEEGNTKLRLYTGAREQRKIANSMYESFGFQTYKETEEDGYKILYRELSI